MAAGSAIQRVATVAARLFSGKLSHSKFQDGLTQLKNMISRITEKDVNFESSIKLMEEENCRNPAPVTYIQIWHDDVISMGIFVLRKGSIIPLHDHPGMHGLCRVIHGKLHLKSYSVLDDVRLPPQLEERLALFQRPLVKAAFLEDDSELTPNDDVCCLTPTVGNIHEIKCVEEPAAFLDILSPPYNDTGINCTYYKLIQTSPSHESDSSDSLHRVGEKSPVQWLIQASQPHHFWCNSVEYSGPPVELDADQQ